ncbi:lycopene cyclase family protein [soil metagenome]
MPVLDVLVLGKGPAGIAIAAELADRGLTVGVLGPSGPVYWPAQYGAWKDELHSLGMPELAEHTWPETVIGFGEEGRRTLPHAYVRVNKQRLREQLLHRCEAGRVRWVDGRAAAVEHTQSGSRVRCDDGRILETRIVVDASGHRPALVQRSSSPAPGFQTAFGLLIECHDSPFSPDQAVLMDWDDSWLSSADRESLATPTFLYAMDFGNGRVFVEETVLVSRPAVPFDALERRLHRRLNALGITPRRILETERCYIPMGGALPDPGQRTVGFGGAAAMVHPATGYLLTRVLGSAPALADTLARELTRDGATPTHASHAAWQTLWPRDRRQRRALFRFGMELLLRLDHRQTMAFFDAFFSLPPASRQRYLGDDLTAAELRGTMMHLFRSVPASLRVAMARTALAAPGMELAASLLRELPPQSTRL